MDIIFIKSVLKIGQKENNIVLYAENQWLKLNNNDPRKMKNLYNIIDWMESIPYYETRNYVQRVLETLQIYRIIINKDNKFHYKKLFCA